MRQGNPICYDRYNPQEAAALQTLQPPRGAHPTQPLPTEPWRPTVSPICRKASNAKTLARGKRDPLRLTCQHQLLNCAKKRQGADLHSYLYIEAKVGRPAHRKRGRGALVACVLCNDCIELSAGAARDGCVGLSGRAARADSSGDNASAQMSQYTGKDASIQSRGNRVDLVLVPRSSCHGRHGLPCSSPRMVRWS